MPRPPLLPTQPVPHLAAVRAELSRNGYSEDGLRARLGLGGASPLSYLSALADPPLIPEPGGPSALDHLVQLFLLGEAVGKAEVERALSAEAVRALAEVQLIREEGSRYRATAGLYPFGELVLAADFVLGPREPDAVLPPDPSAATGLKLMEPGWDDQRRRAVCLQAGTGLHALLLKGLHRFEQVHVDDPNPRALQLTALGAALNGISLELGDLARVEAGSADLVVGVMPGLLRSTRFWSAGPPPSGVEERIASAWTRMEGLLADGGRALMCHEIRMQPPEWLLQILSGLKCAERLEVVWIPALGQAMGDDDRTEYGVALARRRRPGGALLERAGSLMGHPQAAARSMDLHLDSRELIQKLEGDALVELIPYRNGRVAAQQWYASVPKQGLQPTHVQLGTLNWPPRALEVLQQCDNVRTIAQIADGDPDVIKLCLMLALEGAVFLRKVE